MMTCRRYRIRHKTPWEYGKLLSTVFFCFSMGQAQVATTPDPIIPSDSLGVHTEAPVLIFSPATINPDTLYSKVKNRVWLELLIDSMGAVIHAEVKRSTDHRFDVHAVELAYLHRFTPLS